MNDKPEVKESETLKEVQVLPAQQSALDTSNQDNKVSTDPSGEKYIRTTEDDD